MIDLEEAIAALRVDILRIAKLENDRLELLNSPLNPAMKDERDSDLKSDIERQRKRRISVIQNIVEFPPQHTRHSVLLNQFVCL